MKRLRLLAALAVLFVPSLALADAIVAPGALTSVEGTYSNFYPFGIDAINPLNQGALDSQRYQQAYDASVFGGLSGPVTIEGIGFRPDAQYGSAFATTLSDIQINLSTTPLSLDALTGTFASNVGIDDTIVVNRGALSLTSSFTGPAGGPMAFDIYIPLDTAFVYDPTAGNLLLDVRNYAGQVDPSIFPVFDADMSDVLWRGYTTNPDVDGVDNAEATLSGRGFGLVTQFIYTPVETGGDTGPVAVPLPSASVLVAIGLAGVARSRRRRRPR